MTGLGVQGEQLQVHGAGQGQGHSGEQFRLDIIYIYITYIYQNNLMLYRTSPSGNTRT